MFRTIFFILCVCGILTSCFQYNTPDKPEKFLTKEEMFRIILDLKIITEVEKRDKDVLDSLHVTSYRYIKKKYGVDSAQFAENNTYYAYHLEDYKEIFAKVKDSLSKLKEFYKVALEEERTKKRKQDSLKNIEKSINKIELSKELESELIEAISDND